MRLEMACPQLTKCVDEQPTRKFTVKRISKFIGRIKANSYFACACVARARARIYDELMTMENSKPN